MAMALINGAYDILMSDNNTDINALALGELLDRAIRTVDSHLLETIIQSGLHGTEARLWKDRMKSHIVIPKICVLFQALYKHKDAALAALSLVISPCSPNFAYLQDYVHLLLTLHHTLR
jgi:hypothetical protein